MMLEDPIWLEYAVRDEKWGWVIGIKDDAPEEAKAAYAEYEKLQERGIFL